LELINQLVKGLGITEDQAGSGAGLIFDFAKEKLGGDFSQITSAIPEITNLLDKAPSSSSESSLGGMLGGITSALGGDVGNIAGLISEFSNLGLDSDSISKFIPIILSFVQDKGGTVVKDLLSNVLKF